MSFSLVLQQRLAYLAYLTWTVCEMGNKWPYSCCFVGYSFQHLFKIVRSILVLFPTSFFSKRFIKLQVVQLYNSTETDMAQKNFPLSKRSDFHVVVNLSIAVYALPMCMLTTVSVDEILLPRSTYECFIWVHAKTNTSCCLLQAMWTKFGLNRGQKKFTRYPINCS